MIARPLDQHSSMLFTKKERGQKGDFQINPIKAFLSVVIFVLFIDIKYMNFFVKI